MNILPFAQPRGRTSPQDDFARVAVKHTAAGCESGVDWFREARIRVLSRSYVAAVLADDHAALAGLWAALNASIASRSPEAVTRMEKARGLR